MKHCWFLLLLFFISDAFEPILAQTQDSYDYNTERTWGINKNSAGGKIGGFVYKSARRINKKKFETIGVELMNVKNPHEMRIQSQNATGNYFIFGKTNYLYALRIQYGRDIVLFTKAPQQGVEIKAVFAAGPSIGIVAPYYVEISDGNSGSPFSTFDVQYNPNDLPRQEIGNINGTGRLFEGIFDSKIQLGGNAKAALNFELGTTKSQVTGFEIGFLIDAYFKKVVMVPSAENRAVYPTVFFTLFYGRRK